MPAFSDEELDRALHARIPSATGYNIRVGEKGGTTYTIRAVPQTAVGLAPSTRLEDTLEAFEGALLGNLKSEPFRRSWITIKLRARSSPLSRRCRATK